MSGRAGVFLDRDGVVNVPPPPEQRYIVRPEDFRLMPGIAEAIRLFNRLERPVVVVTNQKCVALGRITETELSAIHARMRDLLAAEGAVLADIRHCPHREEDRCPCRKPLPGMILGAAADLDLDPARGWLIGDQPRDIQAGRAAGCRTLVVGPEADRAPEADVRLPHTADLPRWIRKTFSFPGKGIAKETPHPLNSTNRSNAPTPKVL